MRLKKNYKNRQIGIKIEQNFLEIFMNLPLLEYSVLSEKKIAESYKKSQFSQVLLVIIFMSDVLREISTHSAFYKKVKKII